MKTRYYIFGAALCSMIGLGLTSCNNDKFLDVTQYDIVDLEAQYNSDANARLSLNGIYAYNNVSTQDNSWGYKPNLFTGSHPTMDTQCTGWDVKFLNQTWDANVGELGEGWAHAYAAICRANLYLSGLETAEGVTESAKKLCEGEARALRGYFYTWLATTFGRVPMLNTGEDFNNTPNKAAAETYEEMWDFIIEDFQKASELLDWKPFNDEYGRCTKGMAKAYLADAYMWKAYRCPDQAADCYAKAKAELKSIIDSGTTVVLISSLPTSLPTGIPPVSGTRSVSGPCVQTKVMNGVAGAVTVPSPSVILICSSGSPLVLRTVDGVRSTSLGSGMLATNPVTPVVMRLAQLATYLLTRWPSMVLNRQKSFMDSILI